MRNFSFFDKLCLQFDRALKTLDNQITTTGRGSPAKAANDDQLTAAEQKKSAALMRINHVGEICAQALYQGQAFTSKSKAIQQKMQQAAKEENDHLQWCYDRLQQLDSRVSYLNPFWYAGAYIMGAFAGTLSDGWSLGFVVETENQVEQHLASHLDQLPVNDHKSRAIVEQMKIDEAQHAAEAQQLGAKTLPTWIKSIMRFQARVMTTTAYWV
jgi:ubiquinone biosynthesis monooxygenase Coq7